MKREYSIADIPRHHSVLILCLIQQHLLNCIVATRVHWKEIYFSIRKKKMGFPASEKSVGRLRLVLYCLTLFIHQKTTFFHLCNQITYSS